MSTAHVVYFDQFGGPEVLKTGPWEHPTLGAREVRLEVAAFALNRADLIYLHGEHYTLPRFPAHIGSEASGVVIEVY